MISLSVDDPRLERYLKGETLTIEPEEAAHPKGWHLLCVEGYPLGFGKLVNGTLKNKYPAGWRSSFTRFLIFLFSRTLLPSDVRIS